VTEVEPAAFKRELIRGSQGLDLLCYPTTLRMNSMIQVGNHELDAVRITGSDQEIEEGGRVRAARHGYQCPAWSKAQMSHAIPEPIEQSHR
jgi:hypothetical protein